MQDFNKKEVERNFYLDSTSGITYKVINAEKEGEFYYFSPKQLFQVGEKPPILDENLAKRLVRIKNPRNLREFLGDHNLFTDLDGIPTIPPVFEKKQISHPVRHKHEVYSESSSLGDDVVGETLDKLKFYHSNPSKTPKVITTSKPGSACHTAKLSDPYEKR